jgi:hypothetical protein
LVDVVFVLVVEVFVDEVLVEVVLVLVVEVLVVVDAVVVVVGGGGGVDPLLNDQRNIRSDYLYKHGVLTDRQDQPSSWNPTRCWKRNTHISISNGPDK